MKPWEAQIPQKPPNREIKRCYRVYRKLGIAWAGGKIVWLTDKEMLIAHIKYPDRVFDEILEKDSLEIYKKYIHQTIE